MDYLPILSEQSVFKDDVASRKGYGSQNLLSEQKRLHGVGGVVFCCGHFLKADC